MSNDVFGYISHIGGVSNDECWTCLQREADRLGLGLRRLQRDDVYGVQTLPLPEQDAVYFRVTDGPDKESATYLVDLVDYAPEARISLPRKGEERLNLLLSWLDAALRCSPSSDLAIVLTDSNELEKTKKVDEASIRRQIINDSEACGPPNAAYLVSRAAARGS